MKEIRLVRMHPVSTFDPKNPPQTKVCRTCGDTKDREDFDKRPSNADGRNNDCRYCASAKRKGRKEAKKAEREKYFGF